MSPRIIETTPKVPSRMNSPANAIEDDQGDLLKKVSTSAANSSALNSMEGLHGTKIKLVVQEANTNNIVASRTGIAVGS
jgi:hypothetical protein